MSRHIVDARSALSNRLSRPIKTPDDVKVVQRMIAMVLLDNGSMLDELKRTVLGVNGTPGLVSLVALLQQKVGELAVELGANKKKKPEKSDTFGRVVVWFVDKVLPTLVIVLITLLVTFIVDVWLHVDIFGVNPKGG